MKWNDWIILFYFDLIVLIVWLRDGDDVYGWVEIYCNGIWGMVCDDDWDINDVIVVCWMFGFKDVW